MHDAMAVGPNSTAQSGVPCAIHRSAPERIVRKLRYRTARFFCGEEPSRTLAMYLWLPLHLAFERRSREPRLLPTADLSKSGRRDKIWCGYKLELWRIPRSSSSLSVTPHCILFAASSCLKNEHRGDRVAQNRFQVLFPELNYTTIVVTLTGTVNVRTATV